MDHIRVLKRAWSTVWSYRALWVFGLVLALTTASFGNAVLYRYREKVEVPDSFVDVHLSSGDVIRIPGMIHFQGNDDGSRILFNYGAAANKRPYRAGDIVVNFYPPSELSVGVVSRDQYGRLHFNMVAMRPEVTRLVVTIAAVTGALAAVALVLGRVARYVAEVALVRMVDDYSRTGRRYGIRQGLRLGWSRSAWRIFLISWLVNLPVAVGSVALLVLVSAPLLLWNRGSTMAGIVGTFSSLGLLLAAVVFVAIASSVLSLLKSFFWRACVLEDMGALESIRRGWEIVRRHPRDAVLMWLAMFAVDLAWPLAIAPVGFALAAVGVVSGGLLTLLAGGVAGLAVQGVARWVLAGGLVGIPVFFLTILVPLAFLAGLREVYQSSAWTLTYYELRASEGVERRPVPKLAPRGAQ